MTMHSDIEDTKRLMGALVSEADLARGPAFPTLDCKCWGRLAEESSCQVGLLTWRRFEARAGSPNELLYSRLESAKFVLYPLSQILGKATGGYHVLARRHDELPGPLVRR